MAPKLTNAFSDTTTTLNAGSAGDNMDETLVTYIDTTGVQTTTKRPRVILGGDDGSLIDKMTLRDGVFCLPTYDDDLVSRLDTTNELLEDIADSLAKIAGKLPRG